MSDQTVDKEPVTPAARAIVANLHPAIQKDWKTKLAEVEDQAIEMWEEDHGRDRPAFA